MPILDYLKKKVNYFKKDFRHSLANQPFLCLQKTLSFIYLQSAGETLFSCILQNPESLNDLELFGERKLNQLRARKQTA